MVDYSLYASSCPMIHADVKTVSEEQFFSKSLLQECLAKVSNNDGDESSICFQLASMFLSNTCLVLRKISLLQIIIQFLQSKKCRNPPVIEPTMFSIWPRKGFFAHRGYAKSMKYPSEVPPKQLRFIDPFRWWLIHVHPNDRPQGMFIAHAHVKDAEQGCPAKSPCY